MADWTLEVDMVTSQLEDAIGREQVGGGGTGAGADQQQQENTLASGFSKGLKFAGIIGILSQLKVVVDVIGFTMGILSSLISYFVITFIQNVVGFFQDPVRALLGLGVWIVNGIINGFESLANVIAPSFLQPEGGFDFGRLDSEQILAEYDARQAELKAVNENLNGIVKDAGDVAYSGDVMVKASSSALSSVTNAMKQIEKAWANLDSSKSKGIYTSGTDVASSQANYIAKQSIDPKVAQLRANTNKYFNFTY